MAVNKAKLVVGFRATPELLVQMDARRQPGESRSAWTRRVIEEQLAKESALSPEMLLEQLEERLELLAAEQRELAKLVRRATVMVLVKAADLEPSAAQKLVAKHLSAGKGASSC